MKILAIDTSSNLCSCAILEDTNLIKKLELNNGLTHSETLMPLIDKLFKETNLQLKDIDLLVSDIGPGSFTGIRIGVATCKAFSDSLNIPCVGISSLEVLAYSIKKDGLICSTIDCKNDNCYFALYELKNNIYNIIESPNAKSYNEVNKLLENNYKNKNISFAQDKTLNLDVFNLGIAGYNKFIRNNYKGENILPLYLKKPQAQIQLEEKSKNI